MTAHKLLDPKNDFAFKKIFGSEKHKDVLIHFLNDILGFTGEQKIKEVTFISPIQDPETLAKKQSIVDVLCKDGTGRKFIIEMQVARVAGFKERAQYYAARAYIDQMKAGKGDKDDKDKEASQDGGAGKDGEGEYAYKDLKEVIFVAIMNHSVFPQKQDCQSDHTLRDTKTNERDLDKLRFVFVELPKFTKSIDELSSMVDKWYYFLKYAPETTPEELDKLIVSDQIIREAYGALDSFYWNDQEILAYDREMKNELDAAAILLQSKLDGLAEGEKLGLEKGKAEGEKLGLEKGEKLGLEKGMREVAKRMKESGSSITLIKQVTGLDAADIEKL